MRISRKRRPAKPIIPHYNTNEQISSPEVRVIDAEGNNLGVMATRDARAKALELELDLIEINPLATPPVVKFGGFKQFKYQKEKEARKQKANAHVSEVKGVRLSIHIGDHDLEVRRAQAQDFLERGDKVKAEIILRGRENARANLAFDVIEKFYQLLGADMPVQYEQPRAKQGNKVTAIITRK